MHTRTQFAGAYVDLHWLAPPQRVGACVYLCVHASCVRVLWVLVGVLCA